MLDNSIVTLCVMKIKNRSINLIRWLVNDDLH